jgi:hypothetical protein|tara:strand:+ start:1146 stop:1877 length:732 start_codon:yes stop_codon:yes gene_type:complete
MYRKITMKTTIYWSPGDVDLHHDWSILYKDPSILGSDLRKRMSKNIEKTSNLFYCPAVKDLTSRIAVLKAPMSCHYKMRENEFIPVSKNFLNITFPHKPNFENNMMFQLSTSYIFFCEEDVKMTLTSPYFSDSPHLKYGSIIPGSFNISTWFRNINMEFNLWGDIEEFKFKKNEDMAYVHFDSEHEIELKRFDFNERLLRIIRTCSSAGTWEKFVPLMERYKRFKEARFKKIILKEIKQNLLD